EDSARLASHEILAIRQGAWTLARAALPRFRIAPVAIAKLVDTAWEDTRNVAIALIQHELGALFSHALIAICDRARPEVQALGKQLLLEQFRADDAGRYLLRLAEHPSVSVPLLASGHADHAAGQPERLRALAPYLVTVLSQV